MQGAFRRSSFSFGLWLCLGEAFKTVQCDCDQNICILRFNIFARAIKKNQSVMIVFNIKEINDNIEEFCVKTIKRECGTWLYFEDAMLKLREMHRKDFK